MALECSGTYLNWGVGVSGADENVGGKAASQAALGRAKQVIGGFR